MKHEQLTSILQCSGSMTFSAWRCYVIASRRSCEPHLAIPLTSASHPRAMRCHRDYTLVNDDIAPCAGFGEAVCILRGEEAVGHSGGRTVHADKEVQTSTKG